MSETSSGRQLVICCDGTNNNLTGGKSDTNVVKLVQLLAANKANGRQIVFYDPGVGNPGELPGATLTEKFARKINRVISLAFGRGVYENIADSYRFLMQTYQPGDQIYIFGFSRGAFTARCVAGLVNLFGVLRPHMDNMVPTLIHIYFSERVPVGDPATKSDPVNVVAQQMSFLFAAEDSRKVEIQFVGVWDTVASVGMWPFGARFTATPTIEKKCYRNVRQALALDEHRAQFKPRLYLDENGTYETRDGNAATLEQRWFQGSHCDAGGGYAADETGLSDSALVWMVNEACQFDLIVPGCSKDAPMTEAKLRAALGHHAVNDAIVHSELRGSPLWALAGLAVRDASLVQLDDADDRHVKPREDESVARNMLKFPEDSVWAQFQRPSGYGIAAWVFFVALLLMQGEALNPTLMPYEVGIANVIGRVAQDFFLPTQWAVARAFAWTSSPFTPPLHSLASIGWALCWDTLMIGAYCRAISPWVAWGFARRAGLRRVDDGSSTWLNALGWALPLLAFSNLFENLAAALLIWSSVAGIDFLKNVLIVAGVILANGKLIGLTGVVALILAPSKPELVSK